MTPRGEISRAIILCSSASNKEEQRSNDCYLLCASIVQSPFVSFFFPFNTSNNPLVPGIGYAFLTSTYTVCKTCLDFVLREDKYLGLKLLSISPFSSHKGSIDDKIGPIIFLGVMKVTLLHPPGRCSKPETAGHFFTFRLMLTYEGQSKGIRRN